MIAKLIQEKVPIGSCVKFSLKTGEIISGILVEIGLNYISLKNEDGKATILTDIIGAWEILEEGFKKPLDKGAKPETTLDVKVIKEVTEIETRFHNKIQSAKIELKVPDFSLDSIDVKHPQRKEIEASWNRIKNKYEYAQKVNELSPMFGRIQPIVNELISLINQYPTLLSPKRHLAYLHFLLGNIPSANKLYEELSVHSQNVQDWFNWAVLALRTGKEAIACFALKQFLLKTQILKEQDALFVYIGLIRKFKDYDTLKEIVEVKKSHLLEEEAILFLETGIYLLKVTGKEQEATNLIQQWIQGQPPESLTHEVFNYLKEQPTDSYTQSILEIKKKLETKVQPKQSLQLQGYIYTYNKDRNFGFLKDLEGREYFFHKTAIVDEILLNKIYNLTQDERISVVFETTQGPKGPIAIQISLYRTIDEMFKLAVDYAEGGEYSKAIFLIKRVLSINPDYPNASDFYEKWREYARLSGVPKGSSLFARAKRAQLIEKDFDRAANLLRQAIDKGDNLESAIKDLAGLLMKLGRPQEAIEIIEKNRKKVREQQSLDNILIGAYQNAGQYDRAIVLLKQKLKRALNVDKKAQIIWQIANCYLKKGDYLQAQQTFQKVLKYHRDNILAERNIAFCLFKQAFYDDAEKLLNKILDRVPDTKSAQLLEAISQARKGMPALVDEMIVETTLSEFSGELSGFAKFFLNRCEFKGISPNRIKEDEQGQKKYIGSEKDARHDIERLEEIAKQLGTRRPRDRADYYLSAARIAQESGDDLSYFYRYLCRSFASRGDATVSENRLLDTAREWYCEALSVYAGVRGQSKDEQDAVNALVRLLFSLLGSSQIPLTWEIPSIDESIEKVLNLHPQREKAFDFIAYLVFRSRYAARHILNRLYDKASLQAMALEFLKNQGISIPSSITRRDFIHMWNAPSKKWLENIRTITTELRLLNDLVFTTAWLEGMIERVKGIGDNLLFDLDQQRIRQLQKILEICLDLCKQVAFEEKERICILLESRCQDLLMEIESSPTKLSIEEVYVVVQSIKDKVKDYLENLYEEFVPEITLQLPIESYVPDNNQQIEVQASIENAVGRSPAESLELIVQEDEEFYTLNVKKINIDESLRGGEQRILKIPIRLTDHALQSQTFSMTVYAQYRIRSGDIKQTDVYNFSIRLYNEEDFEEIPNPYAAYAEGGVVGDPQMFYGRDELIGNIAQAIETSRTQSKCIVIFGQKRTGKSSLLHHLKRRLEGRKDLMILDLGNIGAILDEYSNVPLLYQILWSILQKLQYAIEDLVNKSLSPLDISFPSSDEFYKNPTPLLYFKQIFEEYKRQTSRYDDWRKLRLVILIDEFSYIYDQIITGRIPEQFMKNWKALLQENYFSAVLTGQDVMPKFKQRFPNEFGTTQDERVTYLKPEDAIRLIDEPIRIGGEDGDSRYRGRAIQRILELTAGSPFYIQIFCNRLVEYMNRRRAMLVTEADIEHVKNELIQGVNALSFDKFDNLINSGDVSEDAISDKDTLKVLKEIAVNSKTGPCHRNSITCETKAQLDIILDDLVKREVLKRERECYYQIRVVLFKEWLIAHQ